MELTKSRRNAVFINLIITCVVLAVVSSSMSAALQPLMVDFGVDAATAGWVSSGYTLALAVSMPLTAYLVTRFATRPLYIFALGLYLALAYAGMVVESAVILVLGILNWKLSR